MAQEIIVDVNVETGEANASVDSLTSSFNELDDATVKTEKSQKGLGEEVRSNGGAIALLDAVTGGLASRTRDAFEASELLGKGFSFARIQATLFGTATRAALTATGIGAIVVAVGLLVTYWDDIVVSVGGVNKELAEQVILTEEIASATKLELDNIIASDNRLQLKGLSELDILNLKIAQLKIAIETEKIAKKARDEQNVSERLTEDSMASLLALIPGGGVISRWIYGTEEERKKESDAGLKDSEIGINKLLEQLAGFQLARRQIQEDDFNEKLKNDELELDEEDDFWMESYNKQVEANRIKLENQMEVDAELASMDDALFDNYEKNVAARLKAEEDAAKMKLALEQQVSQGVIALGALVVSTQEEGSKQAFETQKGFAIASALVNTALAVTSALTLPPPLSFVTAAVTAVAGAAQIVAISKQQYGGSGTATVPSTNPVNETPPPNFNIEGGEGTLSDDIEGALGKATFKTYVVSSDVTNQQELDRRTANQSTL